MIETQVAMRALGFDIKKAEVLKLMADYDRQSTGKMSFADFNDVSKYISVVHLFRLIFIHSFMSDIYTAPLQVDYLEVLQTPARLKGTILRRESNVGDN